MKYPGIFKKLFLILFIFLALGQLTRVDLNEYIHMYAVDLAVVVMVVFWFVHHLVYKKKFKTPPYTKSVLIFLMVASLPTLGALFHHSYNENLIAIAYFGRFIFYYLFSLVIFEFSGIFGNEYFHKGLVISGGLVSILGLLQYFLIPDTRFLYFYGWDDHYYRLIGTYLDPGFTGMVLVLTLTLFLFYFNKKLTERVPIYWVGLLVLSLSILLTYSRASYLALITTIFVFLVIKKKLLLFVPAVLIILCAIILLPRPAGEGVKIERTFSINARYETVQTTLKVLNKYWLLGTGFNYYRPALAKMGLIKDESAVLHSGYGTDVSLLFVWSTTGLFGLIAYLFMWKNLIRDKSKPLIFCSAAALFVHSLFNNSLFYPFILIWMWVIIGLDNKEVL